MKMRFLLFALIAGLFFNVSTAQSIFGNSIDGTDPGFSNPFVTGQTSDANVTVSGIARGTGVVGSAANNRYAANSWNTASLDPIAYFEFTLTPAVGYEINFVNFVYTGQASGTGPSAFAIRSSVDGFASNIGVPTAGGTTISLSAAVYQNRTNATTFRFYGWGASAAGGTFSINDFTFNGTVVSTSVVDWANLQFPDTTTSVNFGTSVTYYARVFEPGITGTSGTNAGLAGEIGYSLVNSNPNTGWTWVSASENAGFSDANNDEYQAVLNLPAGIYYIASRFKVGAGAYRYGGYSAGGGGFWDGASNVSQVLIVNDDNTVDWCNLQTPANGSLVLGGVFDVYGQVYEPSLTPGAGFQGAGITAWLGYSTANTNPALGGWTWVPMNFNPLGGGDDNDEYVQDIGAYLTLPGTYYYATRFQLNSGAFRYGGILSNGTNGGFWDGANYISGVLNVTLPPVQEINLKGLSGAGNNIVSGSMTASGLNNTLFLGTTLGGSSTKDYKIENTGTATLNLTGTPRVALGGANPGDFAITTMPALSAIAPGSSTSFIITFTPTATGTRTAIVSIANNDTDENPYTFLIQGNGNCSGATNVLTPASGPTGTEITVTASANNLVGASATYDGVAVGVTQIDATHIKVVLPANAVSGNLVTTNASGCTASAYFQVINHVISSCGGGGSSSSDLFISEVTDATTGGLSYIEIYNGTGNPIDLGNYALRVFSNGGSVFSSNVHLNSVMLNSGSIYLVALGVSSSPTSLNTCTGVAGGNGQLANQSSTAPGINFDPGNNDHIALVNVSTNTKIDSFGAYLSGNWADLLGLGDRGVVFRRKNTAVVPSVAYSNADWNITDWTGSGSGSCGSNDYSDIGTYVFNVALPPAVTQHPVYSPGCKSTSFTAAGAEGVVGGAGLAYQWYVVAPNTATWTALADAGVYTGSATPTLNISNVAGLDGYQFYCQIRESGANCFSATDAVKISEQTVSWNGSVWSPSPPTIGSLAVINGSYDTSVHGDIDACSLVVNSPATLTIAASDYVNIQNDLTVNTGATLLVRNGGSLVMVDDGGAVVNNGTTQVVRMTSPYNKYDYTYWSSPVTGAAIGATFTGWRTDYAFEFTTSNYADVVAPFDGFDDDQNAWVYTPPATVMAKGKGYAVMAPTTGSFPTTNTVTFSGAANNGVVNIMLAASANPASLTDDFNLIGNPYPSSISADDFINANGNISGTLYFWTHRTGISNSNPGPDANNFITADYAMYNLSGGTSSGTGSPVPNGFVASGEGFFVEADAYTNVLFNNSMRSKSYDNTQFYRHSPQPEKDRLWLNLESADGLFSQQLIAYFDNATLGFDRGYDGLVSQSSNTLSFYSFIGQDKYRIQARPSFDDADVVPLGFSSSMAGTYSISIGIKEGAFTSDQTNVYLEDKQLGIIHDLKQARYDFTTSVGVFNERFVLRYNRASLGNNDVDYLQNQVGVAVSEGQIIVRSISQPIAGVSVFDILGRQIFTNSDVGQNQFAIDGVMANRQPLIVKVRLESGAVVNKKIVF